MSPGEILRMRNYERVWANGETAGTSAAGANTYNPTLAGAETLMTEAYAAFARIAKERR